MPVHVCDIFVSTCNGINVGRKSCWRLGNDRVKMSQWKQGALRQEEAKARENICYKQQYKGWRK